MQNIIVTGGAGFIGTNLIIELLKDKNNKILNIDKLSYCSNSYLKKKREF
jgi:dTDP-glucose 4,6-dehydratase